MLKKIKYSLPIGATVWVSPNNGKSFHSATLIGVRASENNLLHVAFIVEVNDKVRDFVDSPVEKPFVDYFCEVFTRFEMEIIKKDTN